MSEGKNKKYDLVFSIGSSCACSGALRSVRLQFLSFPFDWVKDGSLSNRVEIMENDFNDYFNKEDLFFTIKYEEDKLVYQNKKSGINFVHDFKTDKSFDEYYELNKEKYDRRAKRLLNMIKNSKNILAVYVQLPDDNTVLNSDVLINCQSRLQKKFPEQNIDLLVVQSDKNLCFPEMKIENISDNIRKLIFDYENIEQDKFGVNTKKLKYIIGNVVKLSGKNLTFKNRYFIFLHNVKMFVRKKFLNYEKHI